MNPVFYYMKKISVQMLLVSSGIWLGVNNYEFISRAKEHVQDYIFPQKQLAIYQQNLATLEELIND
jgi:hypothetical protein